MPLYNTKYIVYGYIFAFRPYVPKGNMKSTEKVERDDDDAKLPNDSDQEVFPFLYPEFL